MKSKAYQDMWQCLVSRAHIRVHVYVCTCVMACTLRWEDNLHQSILFYHISSKKRTRAWWQVPLPAKPSCWRGSLYLHILIGQLMVSLCTNLWSSLNRHLLLFINLVFKSLLRCFSWGTQLLHPWSKTSPALWKMIVYEQIHSYGEDTHWIMRGEVGALWSSQISEVTDVAARLASPPALP